MPVLIILAAAAGYVLLYSAFTGHDPRDIIKAGIAGQPLPAKPALAIKIDTASTDGGPSAKPVTGGGKQLDVGGKTPYQKHMALYNAVKKEFGGKVYFLGISGVRPDYCSEHEHNNAVDIGHKDGDKALQTQIIAFIKSIAPPGGIGELCHMGNDNVCNGYHGNHVHVSLNPQFC